MITHILETVPHSKQRYETVGDWYYVGHEQEQTVITSSAMGNWKFELLVKFHELIEQSLCKDRNISEEEVSKFDIDFEASRQDGDEREPGDQIGAPYYREHKFATKLEQLFAAELGVDWNDYEEAVNSLSLPLVT